MVAVRAYAKRRTAEGKTKAEIMRCLKRYIAREAYNALRADLTASPHPTPPHDNYHLLRRRSDRHHRRRT
jgi:hypothetical protein